MHWYLMLMSWRLDVLTRDGLVVVLDVQLVVADILRLHDERERAVLVVAQLAERVVLGTFAVHRQLP